MQITRCKIGHEVTILGVRLKVISVRGKWVRLAPADDQQDGHKAGQVANPGEEPYNSGAVSDNAPRG